MCGRIGARTGEPFQPGRQRRTVKAPADHQQRAGELLPRVANLVGHEGLAPPIALADRLLPEADMEAQGVNALQIIGQSQFPLRFHELVPKIVEIVDGQPLAEQAHVAAAAQLSVGIAMGRAIDVGDVRPGEIDEPQGRADPPCTIQGSPFGRVVGEGIIRAPPLPCRIAEIAVDGNRQLVLQQQFIEMRIVVAGAFDEDGSGPDRIDQVGKQAGRGRTMVPHGKKDHACLCVAEPVQERIAGGEVRVNRVHAGRHRIASRVRRRVFSPRARSNAGPSSDRPGCP